ncbi:hypothetical protein AVEN_48109-1 [Araneus ventricosus]|uniref:Uncharacterized protein n=1 Tax=Araneus ventricosus TaxID=182803 RepID=A0A4Y2W5F0_ARAVE|nr:hypothetical protein AVEN_48109-1 [Araneus ventricosus]
MARASVSRFVDELSKLNNEVSDDNIKYNISRLTDSFNELKILDNKTRDLLTDSDYDIVECEKYASKAELAICRGETSLNGRLSKSPNNVSPNFNVPCLNDGASELKTSTVNLPAIKLMRTDIVRLVVYSPKKGGGLFTFLSACWLTSSPGLLFYPSLGILENLYNWLCAGHRSLHI